METQQLDYSTAPAAFLHCAVADCPVASTCLRALAWQHMAKERRWASVVNPSQVRPGKDCPFFRESAPVVYAWGFAGMQRRMFPQQYAVFSRRLMAHFGRNGYFIRRRGERVLSPQEQCLVRETLKAVGVADDLPFDHYEQRLHWTEE